MHTIALRLFRLLFMLALALYLGGLVALGAVAAPSIFKTVRDAGAVAATSNPALTNPNQLGGEIFGHILARFSAVEMVCLLGMVLAIALESLVLGRTVRHKLQHVVRVVLLVALAGLLAYDTQVLYPQVIAQRTAWRAALGTAQAPGLQAQFDALHQRSESVAHAKVCFLLALLAVTTLSRTTTPPVPSDTPRGDCGPSRANVS